MSFEPYSLARKTETSMRIIKGRNPEATQYPQLNIPIQSQSCQNQQQMIPAVTIPLSFLQQLIQQAQLNKILSSLLQPKEQICKPEQSTAVNNLITQIQNNQNVYNVASDEPAKQLQLEEKFITSYLLASQKKFIQENSLTEEKVKQYLADYQNLLPHFWIWIKQIEFKVVEDMLILCYSNPNHGNRIQNLFKALFQKLSIEYYQNHAYAQILGSNIKDKIKYLSAVGEILSKIANPQDFFYFSQP